MFLINFNSPTPVGSVQLVEATEYPVIVVVDVTSLKALDVPARDLFSSSNLGVGYHFVTIEDFDKIGFHLTKIGHEGTLKVVFCTGSETGEIVYYSAEASAQEAIDPIERVYVNEMPAVEIKAGQTIGLTAGTKIGVSSIDNLPEVGIKQGQSIGVSTLPAVQLADGQKVGLAADAKVAVSQIDALPAVQLKENQSVNIGNTPAVAIAPGQEIGLISGAKVGIDGEISAAIAADQAIGVYPVRRG